MKKPVLFHLAAISLSLGLAGTAQAAESAKADIVDKQGKNIGVITLTEGPNGVLLHIKAQGLTPGAHAIHIHSVGDCSDYDKGFAASKAHVNASGKKHGLMNPEGPDNGDLPNLFVGADGSVEVEQFSTLASLGEAASRANLLDADGSAFVIHEGRDDHITQPIGGAGARVACAVIKAAP